MRYLVLPFDHPDIAHCLRYIGSEDKALDGLATTIVKDEALPDDFSHEYVTADLVEADLEAFTLACQAGILFLQPEDAPEAANASDEASSGITSDDSASAVLSASIDLQPDEFAALVAIRQGLFKVTHDDYGVLQIVWQTIEDRFKD